MKQTVRVAFAVAGLALVAGCASWPEKRFKEVTGIKLTKPNSLCTTIVVRDTVQCIPAVGGAEWDKVKNVPPRDVTPAGDITEQARQVTAGYVGRTFSLDGIDYGCPAAVDPFNHDEIPDQYFKAEKVKSSIASLFSEIAVQEAKAKITATAKAKDQPSLSAGAMATFESELKKRIESESQQSADVVYVQGYLSNDWHKLQQVKPYADCLSTLDPKNQSVITGIAGFYLADFQSRTNVFKLEMMTMAIEAAIDAASEEDKKVLGEVKGEASAEWTSSVNRKLEQSLKTTSFGNQFVPLYIRFDR